MAEGMPVGIPQAEEEYSFPFLLLIPTIIDVNGLLLLNMEAPSSHYGMSMSRPALGECVG